MEYKEDFSRNGLVSNILKNISDFQKFIRTHSAVDHGAQNFVNVTAWTPVVAGITTSGTGTYSVQAGQYSRVGNIVFYNCSLTWSAHTGTGNMKITGLPLVSGNNSINNAVTIFWSNITLLAAGNKVIGVITPASARIDMYEVGSGANSRLPMDTAGELDMSGFYFVD